MGNLKQGNWGANELEFVFRLGAGLFVSRNRTSTVASAFGLRLGLSKTPQKSK